MLGRDNLVAPLDGQRLHAVKRFLGPGCQAVQVHGISPLPVLCLYLSSPVVERLTKENCKGGAKWASRTRGLTKRNRLLFNLLEL